MRGYRRSFLSLATVLTVLAAGLVAAAPARAAAYTTAQVAVMTQGASRGDISSTYSLAAGDRFTPIIGAIRGVTWSRADGSDSWTLTVDAPSDAPLTAGTYEDASSGYGHERRKPELRLNHVIGCASTGRFVVNYVELNADSTFSKLDLYFEHRCRNSMQTTYGRVLLDRPGPVIADPADPAVLLAASGATDPALIRVFAAAPAGVAGITARVSSPETGLEVGSTTSFTRQSGTAGLGVWVASTPLVLGDPGFYRIDTEIVDTTGARSAQSGVGYLAYEVRSEIQGLAFDRDFVDYFNRTSQLTGILVGRQPGTGDTRPIPGADLVAMTPANICACPEHREAEVVGAGVTDVDGSFDITVTVDRSTRVFVVYLGSLANHVVGTESGSELVSLRRSRSKVTAQEIFWGPTMTISGVATYESGEEQVPLANTVIEVSFARSPPWYSGQRTTTTDAQGRYSMTYTVESDQGQVRVQALPADIFIAPAIKDLVYGIHHPGVTFEAFLGFWLSDTTAWFLGGINVPSGAGSPFPIAVQYQAGGTEWTTAEVVLATLSDTSGWSFSITATPPCGHSRWRAVYGAGLPDGQAVHSGEIEAFRTCLPPRRPWADREPVPRRGGV